MIGCSSSTILVFSFSLKSLVYEYLFNISIVTFLHRLKSEILVKMLKL